MLLLLGSTGYVGNAFRRLFDDRRIDYRPVSRRDVDYTDREQLINLIQETNPSFLINCAGYTGKPNVDACELHKAECLAGNAVLPGTIREACEATELPFGHVSSGCIYTGSNPGKAGFTEQDTPNFSFRTNNCSFYSGTKALGEECLKGCDLAYIWRLRIPFDNIDGPRNYLSKLLRYQRLLSAENSISQLNEFVRACWETWSRRVHTGIYNVTNTGYVTTEQVVELLKQHLSIDKEFEFFDTEDQFMKVAAKTPRSNCIMDNSKLLATGIEISQVEDAIIRSLRNWKWERSELVSR